MPVPSLDCLRTPANGQIFAIEKPLSKTAVEAAFAAASPRSSGRAVAKQARQKRTTKDGDCWASLICFPITDTPAFFPNTTLKEHTYGFLLLVEIEADGKWFLGVFKKGLPSIAEWLDDKAKHLPRTKLTNAFSEGAAVTKLNIQRITVSPHELRAASYEAADLQTSLPMMAASRCAIRSVRFNDDLYGSVSVTVSTSRVQRAGGRCTVEELADLVTIVARETLTAKCSAFLGTFAHAIPLDELPAGVTPSSILFDWSTLLEVDELELRRTPANGELGRQVSKRILTRILGETISLAPEGLNVPKEAGAATRQFRCDDHEVFGEAYPGRPPGHSRRSHRRVNVASQVDPRERRLQHYIYPAAIFFRQRCAISPC
jgi:hypothetical protein